MVDTIFREIGESIEKNMGDILAIYYISHYNLGWFHVGLVLDLSLQDYQTIK